MIPIRKPFVFGKKIADDAAVVTTGEPENQLILNCFTRWCKWAMENGHPCGQM